MFRVAQVTLAQAAIQIGFEFDALFARGHLPFFAQSNALRSGVRSIAPRVFRFRWSIAPRGHRQQMLPFPAPAFRHRVREAKGHELREARLVAMGQITALVPAEKTFRFVFGGERF